MEKKDFKFKYVPTGAGIITFYAFLLFNMALMGAKKLPTLQPMMGELFTHTSNFIITSILLITIGFIWTLQGAPFEMVIGLAALAIILNFVVELWIRLLNTPDVVDAYYGSAGALISAAAVYIIKKTGLKQADLASA